MASPVTLKNTLKALKLEELLHLKIRCTLVSHECLKDESNDRLEQGRCVTDMLRVVYGSRTLQDVKKQLHDRIMSLIFNVCE